MQVIDVTPIVTELDEEGYTVALKGTAALASVACGWFKTKIAWWRSARIPGSDILLDIPKSSREPATGTVFDAALYWAEQAPGLGEPLWKGQFQVRSTADGGVVEKVERIEPIWAR
jgi:hypothetical protein